MRVAAPNSGDAFGERVRTLLRVQFVMNASHFMTVPLLALYLSDYARLSPASLATVMAANLVCAQALPVVLGPVIDSFGTRPGLALGLFMRGAGLLGFATGTSYPTLVCSAAVAGSGVALYETSLFGVFGREPGSQRGAIFAANNQMLNLGVIVGPLLGAAGASVSARLCFAISGVIFLALCALTLSREDLNGRSESRQSVAYSIRRACSQKAFLHLAAAAAPWFFLFPQLYITFPIYLGQISTNDLSPYIYVLNGCAGVAYMTWAKRRLTATPPERLMLAGYIAAALLFSSVAFFTNAIWFFLFILGYTVVETTLLPAIETIASTLADDGSQSTFFGVLSLVSAMAGAAGYYAGSWLVMKNSHVVAWLVFGFVGAIGVGVTASLFVSLKNTPKQQG